MNGTHEYPDLSALSTDELKTLKERWWQEAYRDGTLSTVRRVVTELGKRFPKKHGSIWRWERDGVSIWLDDWTGSFGAEYGKAQVCHVSHYGHGVFVPGPWVDVVLAADVEAQKAIVCRQENTAAAERAALLRQLSAGRQ